MSEHSEDLPSYALNTRRTTTALVPLIPQRRSAFVDDDFAAATPRITLWYAVPLLLLLGTLLECLLLALLPILAGSNSIKSDVVQQALPGLFPWLSHFYWTTLFPQVLAWLTQVPWLDPTKSAGNANMQLLLLGLAFLLVFLAALPGRRLMRLGAASPMARLYLFLTLVFAVLLGGTLLLTPVQTGAFSQDMLGYGLYGRMVVIYHVNPYAVSPALFVHDMLHVVVSNVPANADMASPGPVWLDISLLVALFAQTSVANVLLGFRLIGLVAHLLNTILIWTTLTRNRPELRLSATLLYAWNPLVLLLSIFVMHQEVVVALFLALAVSFLLRKAPLMSWVFALLAALVNPLCLVILPLFLGMAFRQSRTLRLGRLAFWWLGFWIVTVLVVVLAYAPYWPELGIAGLRTNLFQVFSQRLAINSLDAALLSLPVQLPQTLLWFLTPLHWSFVVLAGVALLLICALWFAKTVDSLLLCVSWVFLLLLLLMPIYWPWFLIVPLVLALSSSSRATARLAILLSLGGLLCYYCWLWQPVWPGQALLTLGFFFLIWGWSAFFAISWRRNRAHEEGLPDASTRESTRFWFAHSSYPGRR